MKVNLEHLLLAINIICTLVTLYSTITIKSFYCKINDNNNLKTLKSMSEIFSCLSSVDQKLRVLCVKGKTGISCSFLVVENLKKIQNYFLDLAKRSSKIKKINDYVKNNISEIFQLTDSIIKEYDGKTNVLYFCINTDYLKLFDHIEKIGSIIEKEKNKFQKKCCDFSD